MFERLGGMAFRWRWLVLAAWSAVLVAGFLAGPQLFDRLTVVDSISERAESVAAEHRIRDLVSDGPIVYGVALDRNVYDLGLVRSVSDVAERLRTIDGVVDVDDPHTSPDGRIGSDNRSTLVWVELEEDLPLERQEAIEDQVRSTLLTIDAPTVEVGGDHLSERAFGEQAVRDLAVGESVAFALLLVALVVIFGGVIAASVPLVVAITAVSATLLALLAVSGLTAVGEYSLNIVTLLGLGLAVDYALLIVARYREELAEQGADAPTAVRTAMARAGRAVAISGVAVAAALAGLAAFAEPLLASMALGGVVVVLLTTTLALTAVPALIAVAGRRIPPAGAQTWVTRALAPVRDRLRRLGLNALRMGRRANRTAKPSNTRTSAKPTDASLLARLASFAQRHPAPVALATTLGLLILAAPVIGANFANSDARSLPPTLAERRAYDAYQTLFLDNEAAPVTIVAEVDGSSPALRDYLNELLRLPQAGVNPRSDIPAGWVIIDVTPEGPTAGTESRQLVYSIRALNPGFPVLVSGDAAEAVDYQQSVGGRLPYAIAIVVLAMLALLFLLTRSVVIPVKALLLNALTFVATLGVLVVVFQWGWGEPVLRFESWGGVDLTTPLLLFVFLFGLSMDYEVFLLSRIKEEWDRRPKRRRVDNDRAVLAGITRSGPVVTAAALCITIVFLGFAAGGLVAVKEIGVGMAIAVLLDVTVVRGLLLPATMTLLGEWNWWAPTLRRQA